MSPVELPPLAERIKVQEARVKALEDCLGELQIELTHEREVLKVMLDKQARGIER